MHDIIVKLSHKIDSSVRYQKIKSFFRSLLEDVNYPYKKYFDAFMIALIVISISILILCSSEIIHEWVVEFVLSFVTSMFGLESLLRLWIRHDSR